MFSLLPFSLHKVNGHSMQPAIMNGCRVLVFNWAYAFSKPKVGDVIVFRDSDKTYVKRVAAVVAGKSILVEGDNKGDSKKLPPISRKIRGRVVFVY